MELTPKRMCMIAAHLCLLSMLQLEPAAIPNKWMPGELLQAAYDKSNNNNKKSVTKTKSASDVAGWFQPPEMSASTSGGLDLGDAAPAADYDAGGAAPAAPAAASKDASADADADDIPGADDDDYASVVVVVNPRPHQAAPKACAPDAGAPARIAPAPLRRCSSGGSSDSAAAARRLMSNSSSLSSNSEWGSETSELSPAATAAPSLANIGSGDDRALTFEEAKARTAIRGSWADKVDEDEEECGGSCAPLPLPQEQQQQQPQRQQQPLRGGGGNWRRGACGGGRAQCLVSAGSNISSDAGRAWTFEEAVARTAIRGSWADEAEAEEEECRGFDALLPLPLPSWQDQQQEQQQQQRCGGGFGFSSGCSPKRGGSAGGSWRVGRLGGGSNGGKGSAQRRW
ncbi:MAG: hypothetical protein J3K34DRAFT_525667 [Monoraphidium minutum]|nr:MAG: hypothetical protein J3K34DRAFT_525667 [Monoraphidium minutum]